MNDSGDPYGVIDEWMGVLSKEKTSTSLIQSNIHDGARTGLGKKVKAGKKDNLEDRLDHRNKQKQKKERNQEGENEYEGPLHGVVEEEEISKFSTKTNNKTTEDTGVLLISTSTNIIATTTSDDDKQTKKQEYIVAKQDTRIKESHSSVGNAQIPPTGGEPPLPRKKTKTRSKQKNIRKDTRPDEKRPPHLRLHVEEYQGRALTKETVSRLGLKN